MIMFGIGDRIQGVVVCVERVRRTSHCDMLSLSSNLTKNPVMLNNKQVALVFSEIASPFQCWQGLGDCLEQMILTEN